MENNPISTQACYKINFLMQVTALSIQQDKQVPEKGNVKKYINAITLKIISVVPGVLAIKSLDKSKPRNSCKYVMYVRFNKDIHLLLMIQEQGNLQKKYKR